MTYTVINPTDLDKHIETAKDGRYEFFIEE